MRQGALSRVAVHRTHRSPSWLSRGSCALAHRRRRAAGGRGACRRGASRAHRLRPALREEEEEGTTALEERRTFRGTSRHAKEADVVEVLCKSGGEGCYISGRRVLPGTKRSPW